MSPPSASQDFVDRSRVDTISNREGLIVQWRPRYMRGSNLSDGRRREFNSLASADVLSVADRLEMVRPDAGRVTAEMVKFQSVRNRAKRFFVGHAMRQSRSSFDAVTAIAERVLGELPNETGRLIVTVLLSPKMVTPWRAHSPRVMTLDEPLGLSLHPSVAAVVRGGDGRGFAAATFAEFRSRVRSHIGLLHRLIGGDGSYRHPHPNLVGG